MQRVVDERARLAEAARRHPVGLDLRVGAQRVAELEQEADPPQAHLHRELGVVRALAQLERLVGDRQPALGGVGPPHRREPLRERERQRAVRDRTHRLRRLLRRGRVHPARQHQRVVDELRAALALRRPEERQRQLHAQAAAQCVVGDRARGIAEPRVLAHERLFEERDEVGLDDARRQAGRRARQRGVGEVLRGLQTARVVGGLAQRGLAAGDVARAHEGLAEAVAQLPCAPVVGFERRRRLDRALVQARASS